MEKVKAGIIGCGNICPAYVNNIRKYFPHILEIIACADINMNAARAKAEELGIPRACPVDELLSDLSIELVLNLTNPFAHRDVALAVLEAGKHVFGEKPLALSVADGRAMIEKAREKELFLGGASDIFLGAALQETRARIDQGSIGTIVNAQAFIGMKGRTERYMNVFGGAMYDMAPYYLTALVALLGPVVRVTGSAQTTNMSPVDGTAEPPAFERPTNVSAVLDFACGAVATLTATADAGGYLPALIIYGTGGILHANDPNMYGGAISISGGGRNAPETISPEGFSEKGRGLGVAEMAYALRKNRPPRANGDLMFHVLDIIESVHTASREGRHVVIENGCVRPEPFDLNELLAA